MRQYMGVVTILRVEFSNENVENLQHNSVSITYQSFLTGAFFSTTSK